jgi:hypothetical protein
MSDRFPTFEMVLKRRGRKWTWCVRTTEGAAILQGSEANRAAAKNQADRVLLLLLLTAPFRSRRPLGLDIKDAARAYWTSLRGTAADQPANPRDAVCQGSHSWRFRFIEPLF